VVFSVVVIVLWTPSYGWRKVWAWAAFSVLLHGVWSKLFGYSLVCVTAPFELKGLHFDRSGVIILGLFSDTV
jgi:hypothetical protein